MSALSHWIDAERARLLEKDHGSGPGRRLAVLLGAAFPALTPVHGWQFDALAQLDARGWRLHQNRRSLVQGFARAVPSSADEFESFQSELRRTAWSARARIALRELLSNGQGGADIEQTALELSEVSEATLEAALSEAIRSATDRFGAPRRADGETSTVVVFGMGKLGGRELNAGSDIDLIVLYDTDEGASGVSLHEYWTYVTRRMVSSLETPTEDGFVWRVDLRLRPEGSRGPLVYSFAAAERYYETWGRLWERAALLRGRPVAGDSRLGERFHREVILPFVFRHAADPSIATALAALVQQARAELRSDPARDLKLGPGGIREAEFFVQTLQLIWGGRDEHLRVQNTLEGLRRLNSRGLVTERELRAISNAYILFRRTEHAIQWGTGMQTHLLPRRDADRERLARVLGYDDSKPFIEAISGARAAVSELFAGLSPELPAPPSRYAQLLAWLDEEHPDLGRLLEQRFGSAEIADHLLAMSRRPDDLLGAVTRENYPGLADRILDELSEVSDPEQAARYLRSIHARFFSSSAYIAPLWRDPRAVTRLVTVLGSSVFVGDSILARPDLTDLILFQSDQASSEFIDATIAEEVDSSERNEPSFYDSHDRREAFIGALRRAKAKAMVAVAVADLANEIDGRQVTRLLSELADESIERAVQFELGGVVSGLTVIAVGKLGGLDIGYGSDLDVLFVYDPSSSPEGRDPAEFYTRAAQRIIRLISEPHAAGPGYELDTRLRPSGSQGLLVTSLPAFARYHGVAVEGEVTSDRPAVLSSGAAWERQALLRARVVAGDRELGGRTIFVANIAAYERGAAPPEEIHHLRMRMERELGRERPGRYDLKTGAGGLLDVEFAVQWLQMRHGDDPAIRTTDIFEALVLLHRGGYLGEHAFETFRDGYAFLRRLEQRIRVVRGTGSTVIEPSQPGLDKLARRLSVARRPYATEADVLLETYLEVTGAIRQTYLGVLGVE